VAETTGTTGPRPPGFQLACPLCQVALETTPESARCPRCQRQYPCQAGIWRFLPPDRTRVFADFLEQYSRIRADQGWGKPSAAYYRRLPWVEPGDPQRAIWVQRAAHYQAFLKKVLLPREEELGKPLHILDLGAGNGWLSHRLSQRGHCLAAVDVNLDPSDGLGAAAFYPESCLTLQAEFDRLPLAPAQADLVLFNGSFHFSCDYVASLSAALRALNTNGRLVILDTPLYHDPASGDQMMNQRKADFLQQYGSASDALPSAGFLTWGHLEQLARRLGFSWQAIWAEPAWRRAVHGFKPGRKPARELARFPILLITPYPVWKPSLSRRAVKRLWEFGLRWSFQLVFRPLSRRTRLERIDNRSIRVLPGVFNPRLFRTGEYLAKQLNPHLIPPGCRVLDLGTGSGIGAIFASAWAEQVVAVDINPAAVACAQLNCRLNQVDRRVEVRQGDLFSALVGERFDVILFNPPYLQGTPSEPLAQAFYSTDISQRFAKGLAAHLNPGGYALLLLSSLGKTPDFLQALRWQGFRASILAEHDLITERLSLYQVTPAASALEEPSAVNGGAG
jgi:HemK-related putative methylase